MKPTLKPTHPAIHPFRKPTIPSIHPYLDNVAKLIGRRRISLKRDNHPPKKNMVKSMAHKFKRAPVLSPPTLNPCGLFISHHYMRTKLKRQPMPVVSSSLTVIQPSAAAVSPRKKPWSKPWRTTALYFFLPLAPPLTSSLASVLTCLLTVLKNFAYWMLRS